MDSRKRELTLFFQDHIIRVWEEIVVTENRNSGEALKALCVQRISKLKKLQKRLNAEQECMTKYAEKTMGWLFGIKVCDSKCLQVLKTEAGPDCSI
jgi:hypothetical protein